MKAPLIAVLEHLRGGMPLVSACRLANVELAAFFRAYVKDEALRAEVEASKAVRILLVEDALFASAVKGNRDAQEFILCNTLPLKWKSTRRGH